MIIILFRHGLAEEAGQLENDAARQLTLTGRRRLAASLPGLRRLLATAGQPQIWSSPLVRAAETAALLAEGFGDVTIRYLDALADGNWTEVKKQLLRTNTSQPVLMVGHEPTLGYWSEQLCGLRLPFKKGSAAAFDQSKNKLNEYELLWFVQPATLRCLK